MAAVDDGFEPVARVGDVRDGAPLGVATPGGARVCLVRSGGAIRALADGCTHQEFPLSAGDVLPDGSIQCPWHGARFDTRTGAVLAGPACDSVRVWEVRVEGEVVLVRGSDQRSTASDQRSADVVRERA